MEPLRLFRRRTIFSLGRAMMRILTIALVASLFVGCVTHDDKGHRSMAEAEDKSTELEPGPADQESAGDSTPTLNLTWAQLRVGWARAHAERGFRIVASGKPLFFPISGTTANPKYELRFRCCNPAGHGELVHVRLLESSGDPQFDEMMSIWFYRWRVGGVRINRLKDDETATVVIRIDLRITSVNSIGKGTT